jgi:acyl-CoA thioester hydrolase
MTTDTRFDLRARATFATLVPVTIRYSDQDPLGHVNNVAVAAYLEVGRTELYGPLLARFGAGKIDTVVARLTIDYLAEFHYPGTAEVGTRIIRLGTKSLTVGSGIFVGDRCVATAECVSVLFDMTKRASTEPPPDLRRELERLMRDGA